MIYLDLFLEKCVIKFFGFYNDWWSEKTNNNDREIGFAVFMENHISAKSNQS